jgi:hypothetical protein
MSRYSTSSELSSRGCQALIIGGVASAELPAVISVHSERFGEIDAENIVATHIVVDCDSACVDYFEDVLPDQQRSVIVDPDAGNFRMGIDNVYQPQRRGRDCTHGLPRQAVAAAGDAAVQVRVAAFTAAERDVEAKENVIELTRNYHDSGTVGVSHPSFIKATDTRRHFSEVVKQDQIDGTVQPTQILGLDQQIVSIAETIIAKATQGIITANVRPAESFHQIKRHTLSVAGL